MTQSIHQLITATLNDPNFRYLPPERVAWEVLANQVNAKDWRNTMAPLVVDAVRGAIRKRAAAAEEKLDTMPDIAPNPAPPAAAKSSVRGKATNTPASKEGASSSGRYIHVKNRSLTTWLVEMSDVLETTWTEGDVEVSWKMATVEQHQRRIDMLSVMKNGLEHTIERHRKARDHCIANGVARLVDLMDEGKEVAA